MPSKTFYTPDDVVERGKALYEQGIRAKVEQENKGKLLMIDIETGAWEIGDDRLEIARRVRANNPDAVLYGLRIGYPAAGKIGAWPLPRDIQADPNDPQANRS